MLPENARILFVQADSLGNGDGIALGIAVGHIDVVNLAQAVTPQGERVGHAPEADLTSIKNVFPVVRGTGVGVGYDHLRERCAMQNRPHPPLVLIAHSMQYQSLDRVHGDAKAPFLPANLVSVDLKTCPFGLGDLDRTQIGAQRPDDIR